MFLLRALSVAGLLLVLVSCGGLPPNVVVLLPDENGKVGRVIVDNAGGSTELHQDLAAVETKPGAKPGAVFLAKQQDVSDVFAGALAGTPRTPIDYTLYFLAGKTELAPQSNDDLKAAIASAKKLSNIDVSVVGHADATGSDTVNNAISLARAQVVRDALVSNGIPSNFIEVTSHGSNNPRVPQVQGVAEPLNRRVEITIR